MGDYRATALTGDTCPASYALQSGVAKANGLSSMRWRDIAPRSSNFARCVPPVHGRKGEAPDAVPHTPDVVSGAEPSANPFLLPALGFQTRMHQLDLLKSFGQPSPYGRRHAEVST